MIVMFDSIGRKKAACEICAMCGKRLKSTDTWLVNAKKYCGQCRQQIWDEQAALTTQKTDERILMLIKGQRYLVHHHDEEEYSYLGESGMCIEILNDTESGSLFIDRDDEYTVSFEYHHCHYSFGDDEQISRMMETIDGILHNTICAVSIGSRGDNGQFVWSGSCFLPSETAREANAIKDLFPQSALRQLANSRCTEILFQFWDGSLNKSTPVSSMR